MISARVALNSYSAVLRARVTRDNSRRGRETEERRRFEYLGGGREGGSKRGEERRDGVMTRGSRRLREIRPIGFRYRCSRFREMEHRRFYPWTEVGRTDGSPLPPSFAELTRNFCGCIENRDPLRASFFRVFSNASRANLHRRASMDEGRGGGGGGFPPDEKARSGATDLDSV